MSDTVTVRVVGGEARKEPTDDATDADLLRAVGRGPHDATALVDDRPVPADAAVDAGADEVRVRRLVVGG